MPIPDHCGYEASSDGRVRSLGLPKIWGNHVQARPGRILKQGPIGRNGEYLGVKLGTGRQYLVHRLIALAFHANPLELPEVNHEDGVKRNNRPGNLTWSTPSGNHTHRCRVLGLGVGERNGMSKLKASDVPQIIAMRKAGASLDRIAAAFGVTRWPITRIVNGSGWQSVNHAQGR